MTKTILATFITLLLFSTVAFTLFVKTENNTPYIITHIDSDNYYHATNLESGQTVVFLLSDDRVNDPIREIGTLVRVKTDINGENPLITLWREN